MTRQRAAKKMGRNPAAFRPAQESLNNSHLLRDNSAALLEWRDEP